MNRFKFFADNFLSHLHSERTAELWDILKSANFCDIMSSLMFTVSLI